MLSGKCSLLVVSGRSSYRRVRPLRGVIRPPLPQRGRCPLRICDLPPFFRYETFPFLANFLGFVRSADRSFSASPRETRFALVEPPYFPHRRTFFARAGRAPLFCAPLISHPPPPSLSELQVPASPVPPLAGRPLLYLRATSFFRTASIESPFAAPLQISRLFLF